MNRDRPALLVLLAASTVANQAAPAVAQPAGSDAAPTGAVASPLPPVAANTVTVLAITGKPGARRAAGEPIKPIKPGDQLGEGAEIITPAKSVVQIRIGENQVFSIDQLSRVSIKEAVARGTGGVEKDTTTLDVPYGRVKFNITSTVVANDVQITALDATLAVKGTIGGIEVFAGQPTFAFGGELNNGRFEVRFGGRQRAVVTRAEKVDAKLPNAAAYERRQQYVETKDKKSREGDEEETVIANDQVFFALFERLVRETITTEPFDLFAFDESTGSFGRADIFGGSSERRIDTSNLNLNNGPGTGAAVLHDGDGAFLLRLESSDSKGVSSRLLSIPLVGQNPRGRFELVAEYRSQGLLTGLGALQSRVFAVEDLGSEGRIVELLGPSGQPKGAIDVVTRMELGMRLDSGLAGVTSSGFLVAVGRLPDTGLSNGTPGVLGADAALLFLDPRNNYIAGAISDVNGLFQLTSGTDVSGGQITDTQRVTGVGTLAVPFLGQFVVLSTRSTVNGIANTPGFILLNLNSDLSNERPVVFATGSLDSPIEGLAGEARGTPPSPRQLPLADLPIDPSLSPMFADLAYSQLAVASGVVERIARNAILQTARDAQACRVSTELNDQTLLVALFILSDQRAGMGQAISFFRNTLPMNHPCLSPPLFIQAPGSPVMQSNQPFVGPLDHVAMTQQFLMARYGQDQMAGGVASHLAGELVAATAANPAACRASGELTGPRLGQALAAGVDQPGGINQAVNQFRSGLPENHPCRTRR